MPLASSLYWAARAAVQRVATAGFTTLADPMFDETPSLQFTSCWL